MTSRCPGTYSFARKQFATLTKQLITTALPLRDFPHLIFCRVFEDRVDVWRVLHSRRDVAAVLVGEDS